MSIKKQSSQEAYKMMTKDNEYKKYFVKFKANVKPPSFDEIMEEAYRLCGFPKNKEFDLMTFLINNRSRNEQYHLRRSAVESNIKKLNELNEKPIDIIDNLPIQEQLEYYKEACKAKDEALRLLEETIVKLKIDAHRDSKVIKHITKLNSELVKVVDITE